MPAPHQTRARHDESRLTPISWPRECRRSYSDGMLSALIRCLTESTVSARLLAPQVTMHDEGRHWGEIGRGSEDIAATSRYRDSHR
jgi:hypothetical protein